MIKRLYAHNFCCLENFELSSGDESSCLLIGNNGVGKTTILAVLGVLQQVARGTNAVSDLVSLEDFSQGRKEIPIRFELEAELEGRSYHYSLAFDLPSNLSELRVVEESLLCAGAPVYTRKEGLVTLHEPTTDRAVQFMVDWHTVALPVIQLRLRQNSLEAFKDWLARMILLQPIPQLMTGDSKREAQFQDKHCFNFAEWFSGFLSRYPAAYTEIEKFLRGVLPDFRDFLHESTGKESKSLVVRFSRKSGTMPLSFTRLSDGEKVFFICATLLAAVKVSEHPVFCFWDEPDNFVSPSEVDHLITSLRRAFHQSGQLFVTSHNPQAILKFSNENTFILQRRSHLEPTQIRKLDAATLDGTLLDALLQGDLNDPEIAGRGGISARSYLQGPPGG